MKKTFVGMDLKTLQKGVFEYFRIFMFVVYLGVDRW
jgi:hypothetical protein